MQHSAEMRRCLLECDVAQARKLWAHVSPHMPQPESDDEALAVIHLARTRSGFLPFRHRAYSHRWLTERSLPSMLPDRLKPKAERMYPRIVEGVGISVNARPGSIFAPITKIVRAAMEDVVMDAYCDSRSPDPERLKLRMREAKQKSVETLLGIKPDASPR